MSIQSFLLALANGTCFIFKLIFYKKLDTKTHFYHFFTKSHKWGVLTLPHMPIVYTNYPTTLNGLLQTRATHHTQSNILISKNHHSTLIFIKHQGGGIIPQVNHFISYFSKMHMFLLAQVFWPYPQFTKKKSLTQGTKYTN